MSALETLFKYIDEHQDLYVQVSFMSFVLQHGQLWDIRS